LTAAVANIEIIEKALDMILTHRGRGSLLVLAFAAIMLLPSCDGGQRHDDATASASVSKGAERSTWPLRDDSGGGDWPGYGRSFGEQHYSPLTQVSARTVKRLGLAWSMDLPAGNSISAPIAVNGVLYTATGYSIVRAIDAVSGRLLWSYDPKVPEVAGPKLRTGWGIRGLAWWNGKIYVGTHDGRLVALNAATGKPVWSVRTLASESIDYITGAPRAFDGKIIIGFGGADAGSTRGYVTAYDAETGRQRWRFYTVPGDPTHGPDGAASDSVMAMAAQTWNGKWWRFGGGGTVWNAMTYDPETDTVFLGTGNGSPWNKQVRSPGDSDDLFLCSIIAVDGKTGRYKWHYQVNPGETWDYNAAMDMQLANLVIDGKLRKVLMQAPKNGFFYVIDRLTGKLISAAPFAKVNWATRIDPKSGRPVEVPAARYPDGERFMLRPNSLGAHGWLPMSFSAETKLVYIPTLELATGYDDRGIDLTTWKRLPGAHNDNAVKISGAPDAFEESYLQAWDPVAQKQVWKVKNFGRWPGGTAATAGRLVFQGQADGLFAAYDAQTGKKLWSFDAGAPVIAPPITYEAGGKQYVTVLVGFGLSFAILDAFPRSLDIDYHNQIRRILTFTLDGKAVLPIARPQPIPELEDDRDFRPDAAKIAAGELLFHTRSCAYCHGLAAIGSGQAPDLRNSAVPRYAEVFEQIVRVGVLVPNGMPRFDYMTNQDLENLRFYLRDRGGALRSERRKHRAS
jgi:quinohemoprotein ethanol dehydrogenase